MSLCCPETIFRRTQQFGSIPQQPPVTPAFLKCRSRRFLKQGQTSAMRSDMTRIQRYSTDIDIDNAEVLF